MNTENKANPSGDWGPGTFVGGHVALDFTNTVGGYKRERIERLNTYTDLVEWAAAAEIVDPVETVALAALATVDPDRAADVLTTTITQREALHRWLRAAATGDQGIEADRGRVVDDVTEGLRGAKLTTAAGTGPGWLVTIDEAGLALPSRRIALATNAFLSGEDRHHIALCGRCSWLYLDPSPSRRRRWCSMATCGNRAKAERHHARSS